MTRFARAKGSKSSNEKKPEEATSWSEMKNAMFKKPAEVQESFLKGAKENEKDTFQTEPEWAAIDDATDANILLINKHKNKKIQTKKTKSGQINEENSAVLKGKTNKLKKSKKVNKETETHLQEEQPKPLNDNDSSVKIKKRKLSEPILKNKTKRLKKEMATHFENELSISSRKKMESANVNDIYKKSKSSKKLDTNKQKVKNTSKTNVNFSKKIERKNTDRNNQDINANSQSYKKFNPNFSNKKRFSNDKNTLKKKFFSQNNSFVDELIINGEKIPIVKFQGFNVTLEDAERLKSLRNDMLKEGIPKGKLEAAIKLERRRAEKALSRLKKAVCFHCRGHGHLLSNCPNLTEKQNTSTGICYKCGSTEHSALECKVIKGTNFQFAECFICKEQGHIARQCPDNPRGLYPQGGACRECGDVTHLKKDCPQALSKKTEEVITVGVRNDRDLECLDEEIANRKTQNFKKSVKKKSTVKF